MSNLKIAVIGSGSTYTPELIEGFLKRGDSLRVESLYLMDINADKNGVVSALAERMVREAGAKIRVVPTVSLEEAVEGADYVLGQVRVGGLACRILDEKIPPKYGMLGQETTGAGGMLKGLRTIPVILNVAREMEKRARKGAWLINFSNPSGMAAQALLEHTDVRMAGLCNNAVNMLKELKGLLPPGAKAFDYDYVGLNHLSWVTAVYAGGENVLPAWLAGPELGGRHDGHFGGDGVLAAAGAFPCHYLNYYYNQSGALAKLMEAEKSRGEQCVEIEAELLKKYRDETLRVKPAELEKRGGALYSEAAASLVDAIENDKGEHHVVNTANKGALPFMADDDVIEIKCVVGKNGPIPVPPKAEVSHHIIGLTQAVKAYERLAVKAAVTGCRKTALAALMTHPLVLDHAKAKPMLDEMLEANKAYLPLFK
ncbi:MAG: 6-phospho-beta-glucosidase [Oscillospiraceae bacterium]|nr:6-phospho-beta-glucosidase [Oscillospiraceae bacterium]